MIENNESDNYVPVQNFKDLSRYLMLEKFRPYCISNSISSSYNTSINPHYNTEQLTITFKEETQVDVLSLYGELPKTEYFPNFEYFKRIHDGDEDKARKEKETYDKYEKPYFLMIKEKSTNFLKNFKVEIRTESVNKCLSKWIPIGTFEGSVDSINERIIPIDVKCKEMRIIPFTQKCSIFSVS